MLLVLNAIVQDFLLRHSASSQLFISLLFLFLLLLLLPQLVAYCTILALHIYFFYMWYNKRK